MMTVGCTVVGGMRAVCLYDDYKELKYIPNTYMYSIE